LVSTSTSKDSSSYPGGRATVHALSAPGIELHAEIERDGGIVVMVRGEVDSGSAATLARFLCEHAQLSSWLVVSMAEVDFFGAAGIDVLADFDARCRRRNYPWALVCGGTVDRLLRLCKVDMPKFPSVSAASSVLRAV
jgi:anti-anti-sigma factor